MILLTINNCSAIAKLFNTLESKGPLYNSDDLGNKGSLLNGTEACEAKGTEAMTLDKVACMLGLGAFWGSPLEGDGP